MSKPRQLRVLILSISQGPDGKGGRMKTANSAAGQRILSHSNMPVPNKQKKVMLDAGLPSESEVCSKACIRPLKCMRWPIALKFHVHC